MICDFLSKHCLALGIWLAPRYMQPIAVAIVESMKGIPAQIELGRTGGLITARWSTDEDGKQLGKQMETRALEAVAQVRAHHELRGDILEALKQGNWRMSPPAPRVERENDPYCVYLRKEKTHSRYGYNQWLRAKAANRRVTELEAELKRLRRLRDADL